MTKTTTRTIILIFLLAAVIAVILFLANSGSQTTQNSTDQKNFLQQFVISGGPIVWFVLLPMSMLTVYLVIDYSMTISRKKLIPEKITDQISSLIEDKGHTNVQNQLSENDDLLSIAVTEALSKGRSDWFRIKSILAESFQDQALILLRKIEWINLIGNVSPMVGLFGTVFGMIKLFNAIVVAGGQPQPAALASGISVALVTTFWGLFIAIPALAIYGIFRNKIETLISDAVVLSDEVTPAIKKSIKKQQLQLRAKKENTQ